MVRLSFSIILLGALALTACNSSSAPKPEAAAKPLAIEDYKKLGSIHAHHTPEQHAAFLKRVGQLQEDEGAEVSGGGGGGGGHHH
jgi:hypothetical protein